MKRKEAILVISPLVAGFLVYFSCRTRTLAYYQWIPFKENLDLDSIHFAANERCGELLLGTFAGNTIVYSLPAALFAFSLTCYLKFRYLKHLHALRLTRFRKTIFFLALILLISVLPELLQLYGLISGHFDLMDVLTAATASLLALIIS